MITVFFKSRANILVEKVLMHIKVCESLNNFILDLNIL